MTLVCMYLFVRQALLLLLLGISFSLEPLYRMIFCSYRVSQDLLSMLPEFVFNTMVFLWRVLNCWELISLTRDINYSDAFLMINCLVRSATVIWSGSLLLMTGFAWILLSGRFCIAIVLLSFNLVLKLIAPSVYICSDFHMRRQFWC